MNNAWKKVSQESGKAWQKTKDFLKTAFNKTVEESKVARIRASEAGKLTALNTQRYKVQREINDLYHELGARIYSLFRRGKTAIPGDQQIESEVADLQICETQLNDIDQEIGELRKVADQEVKKIHNFHQKTQIEGAQEKKAPGQQRGRK